MTTRQRTDEAWHRYGAALLAVVAVVFVATCGCSLIGQWPARHSTLSESNPVTMHETAP